jgi:prepilin-type N-terminal cleavage/methylation domain-containing protein
MHVRSSVSKGFTIVELLVVASILAIVSVGVLVFFRDTMTFNTSIQSSLRSQNEARRILRPFANEVRGATRSALGAYPIELASSTSLIFFTDLDEDGHSERIRYFLEGDTFKKGVTEPSGAPLSYDLDDERIVAIVNNVVATTTPVFQYFNTNYVGASTTPALAQPVSPALVRLVRVNITVDENPNQPPAAFTLTTQISFRNLKDNL